MVWKTLKRTLQSNRIQIDTYDPFAFFTVSALQPEPIPIQTKVVVMGHPSLYYLLYFNDSDFGRIFKVRADFVEEMDNTADASGELCPLYCWPVSSGRAAPL